MKQSIRCRLGFHRWTRWGAPVWRVRVRYCERCKASDIERDVRNLGDTVRGMDKRRWLSRWGRK